MTQRPPKQIGVPYRYQRVFARAWKAVRTIRAGKEPRFVLLVFHEIGDTAHGIPTEEFERQMYHLHQCATVVSVEGLMLRRRQHPASGLTCAITFDDGYLGVYRHAYPVLRRYNFPATVYLCTDAIGERDNRASDSYSGLDPGERMLNWRQIREMCEGQIIFGSHLCQHYDLSQLDRAIGLSELRTSKETIEDHLGTVCEHFAFPWGRFRLQNLDWVREAGYNTAATAVHRGLPLNFDPYRIPRPAVHKECSFDDFVTILAGDWDYLGVAQMIRRPISRLAPRRLAVPHPSSQVTHI